MKVFRALLLATPATLVACAAAQAADLPAKEAAPITYVRVCDAYGAGFFFIPGTDTCLRVGGYVRVETEYAPGKTIVSPTSGAAGAITQVGGAQDQIGLEARGRVDVDARTQTAWGTAQTVVDLRATSTDGLRNAPATSAAIAAGGFYAPGGQGATTVTMERAFIRFAGLTAGIAPENFDVMPGYMYFDMPFQRYPNGVEQFAYTATFGAGYSATLAAESRFDINYSNGVSQFTYVDNFETGYNLVGNVRYDANWGFVQLQGALGQNSVANSLAALPNSVTLANAPAYQPLNGNLQRSTAFAVGGTVRVDLPMLAAGDQLHLTATYSQGLLGLVGCSQASSCTDSGDRRLLGGVLRVDQNMIPVATNGAPGAPNWISWGQTSSYMFGGIFTHYWAPDWRTNIAGAYQRFQAPTAAASAGLQLGSANIYMISTNLIWTPVKNFDLGVEVAYSHLDQQLQNDAAPNVSAAWIAAGRPGLSNSNWAGKLRLERQF